MNIKLNPAYLAIVIIFLSLLFSEGTFFERYISMSGVFAIYLSIGVLFWFFMFMVDKKRLSFDETDRKFSEEAKEFAIKHMKKIIFTRFTFLFSGIFIFGYLSQITQINDFFLLLFSLSIGFFILYFKGNLFK